MTRSTLVAGNWKMNLGRDEAVALGSALARDVTCRRDGVEVAVFPPFPWLLPVRDALRSSGILVGAQNCSPIGVRRIHRRSVGADARAGVRI